jgi:hypothetical protein
LLRICCCCSEQTPLGGVCFFEHSTLVIANLRQAICNNYVCRYNARLRGNRKIIAVAKKQYGSVAQLVEQMPEEHRVGGSIPPRATRLMNKAGSRDPALFISDSMEHRWQATWGLSLDRFIVMMAAIYRRRRFSTATYLMEVESIWSYRF